MFNSIRHCTENEIHSAFLGLGSYHTEVALIIQLLF